MNAAAADPIDRRAAALEALLLLAAYAAVIALAVRLDWLWLGPAATAGAVAAILWRLRRRASSLAGALAQIGVERPRHWGAAVGVGLLAWLAASILAALLSRLLGGAPDTSALDFVRGSLPGLLVMLAVALTAAAVGEEIVFRGFLQRRFATALGGGRAAAAGAVLLQAALFGLAHSYQGAIGVALTGAVGLTAGLATLWARGNLAPAILAHAVIDAIGLVAVHLNLDRLG
jgi:membrane protease YdiL (CAAX protease family)